SPRPDFRLHGPGHVAIRAAAPQPAVEHAHADGVLPPDDSEGGARSGAVRPGLAGGRRPAQRSLRNESLGWLASRTRTTRAEASRRDPSSDAFMARVDERSDLIDR